MLGDLVRRVRSLRVVALWALLTVILGVAGPFGTDQALNAPQRTGFWAAVSALGLVIGIVTFLMINRCCAGRPSWQRIGVAMAIFTAIFLPVLRVLILALHGRAVELAHMVVAVALVPAVVGLAKDIWLQPDRTAETDAPPAAGPPTPLPAPPPAPRLLDRLEPALRGAVLHLSVNDHYVEVLTENGQGSILMRFSDAVAELEGVEGIQTHRSHWVARAGVAGSGRRDGKTHLLLKGGREVPVSRGFLPKVRAAGYLSE